VQEFAQGLAFMTADRQGSIAVVIPTRNGARYIEETLRSVANQTRPPDDVVVVDDGSTDATADIVASFRSMRLLENAGTGANPARATGTAATSSDYVAFLDHDDIWYPHHLQTIAALLDDASNPAAFSRFKAFRDRLELEPPREARARPFDLWREFPVNHPGGPSAVVVRRSALEAIGGWPTWNRKGSDAYVWYRLADLGPFLEWPFATTGWRRHSWSMTADLYRTDPGGHVFVALELLGEALEVHLRNQPADAERLTADFEEYSLLTGLVSAMCHYDVDTLVDVLDGLVARAPLRDDIVTNAQRGLSSALAHASLAQRNIWRSLGAWPRSERALRRKIVDPILVYAIASAVQGNPGHPTNWAIPWSPEAARVLPSLLPAAVRAIRRRLLRRFQHSKYATAGLTWA
jgi:hypothetical protein